METPCIETKWILRDFIRNNRGALCCHKSTSRIIDINRTVTSDSEMRSFRSGYWNNRENLIRLQCSDSQFFVCPHIPHRNRSRTYIREKHYILLSSFHEYKIITIHIAHFRFIDSRIYSLHDPFLNQVIIHVEEMIIRTNYQSIIRGFNYILNR